MPRRQKNTKPITLVVARKTRAPKGASKRRQPSRAVTQVATRSARPPRLNGGATRTIARTGAAAGATWQDFAVGSHPKHGRTLRVFGVDYIGAVKLPAGEEAGTILARHNNTVMHTSTALATIASLYTRWWPVKFRYVFRPSVPEGTTPGTIIMGQDPDIIAEYKDGDESNVARLRALGGSTIRSAWQVASCDLSSMADYTSLWCFDPDIGASGPTDRLDVAGQFVMAVAAKTSLAAGTTLGTLELEYDVHFYSRRLSLSASTREAIVDVSDSTLASTMRGYLSASRGIFDSFMRTVRPNLSNIASRLLEPVAEDYRFYEPYVIESETKAALGVTLARGGFGPGKYQLTAYIYSPTVNIDGAFAQQVLSPVFPNTEGVHLEGPSITYDAVGQVWTAKFRSVGAGGVMPGRVAPFTSMYLQYTMIVPSGATRAMFDVPLNATAKSLLPADARFIVGVLNAACESIADTSSSTASVARGTRVAHKPLLPAPLTRVDESDDFEDYPAPHYRHGNFGPGMGAGVPGSADYHPRVAGSTTPHTPSKPKS